MMEPEDVTMPTSFGKFPGFRLGDLPTWYLKFVAENWREDTPQNKAICEAADKVYSKRKLDGDD